MSNKHIIQKDIKKINELFLYTLKFAVHDKDLKNAVRTVFGVSEKFVNFIADLPISDIEKIANLKIPLLKQRVPDNMLIEIKRALKDSIENKQIKLVLIKIQKRRDELKSIIKEKKKQGTLKQSVIDEYREIIKDYKIAKKKQKTMIRQLILINSLN
jgi:hypothetical protein